MGPPGLRFGRPLFLAPAAHQTKAVSIQSSTESSCWLHP